jgi:hypothetical protein
MSADTGAVYVLHPKPEPVTLTLPEPVVASWYIAGSDPDDSDRMMPAERCGTRSAWDSSADRGCDKEFEEGDHLRKLRGTWLHANCARDAITAADVDEAWLLIADQVAARPHKFRASDIRVVMRAVSAIAARRSTSPRGGDTG